MPPCSGSRPGWPTRHASRSTPEGRPYCPSTRGKEPHMAVKVQVIFYSLYTHVYRLAEAVAEGAREVPGAEVLLAQVAETLPGEVLEKMGATEARKVFAHVPLADP